MAATQCDKCICMSCVDNCKCMECREKQGGYTSFCKNHAGQINMYEYISNMEKTSKYDDFSKFMNKPEA